MKLVFQRQYVRRVKARIGGQVDKTHINLCTAIRAAYEVQMRYSFEDYGGAGGWSENNRGAG